MAWRLNEHWVSGLVIESFFLSEAWITCPFSSCCLTGSQQCELVPKCWTRNQESSLPLNYWLTFRKSLSSDPASSSTKQEQQLCCELCERTKLYYPLFKSRILKIFWLNKYYESWKKTSYMGDLQRNRLCGFVFHKDKWGLGMYLN